MKSGKFQLSLKRNCKISPKISKKIHSIIIAKKQELISIERLINLVCNAINEHEKSLLINKDKVIEWLNSRDSIDINSSWLQSKSIFVEKF
eukprot:338769_1